MTAARSESFWRFMDTKFLGSPDPYIREEVNKILSNFVAWKEKYNKPTLLHFQKFSGTFANGRFHATYSYKASLLPV